MAEDSRKKIALFLVFDAFKRVTRTFWWSGESKFANMRVPLTLALCLIKIEFRRWRLEAYHYAKYQKHTDKQNFEASELWQHINLKTNW